VDCGLWIADWSLDELPNTLYLIMEIANMKNFRYYMPTKIFFGKHEISKIGEVAEKFGSNALVVTDKNIVKLGIADKVIDSLKKANLEFSVFDKVIPNPTSTLIDEGGEFARNENCNLIIGVGGGSSLDSAKGIAVSSTHEGSVWNYVAKGEAEYDKIPTSATLPIIAIPTTAGTGSEVNCGAVITNPETKEKPVLFGSFVFPKVAIVDPELTITMPPKLTATTGIDVLFHAIEAYTSQLAQPLTDRLCEDAINLVFQNLPKSYDNGKDVVARTNMAYASTLAGIAVNNAFITLLHGLEHPVSGHYNVTHGEGIAAIASEFMEYSYKGNLGKFAKIAELMGENISGLTMEEGAAKSVSAVQKLLKRVDLDITLSDLGVEEDNIETMVKDAQKYMASFIELAPVKANTSDLVKLYKDSFT